MEGWILRALGASVKSSSHGNTECDIRALRWTCKVQSWMNAAKAAHFKLRRMSPVEEEAFLEKRTGIYLEEVWKEQKVTSFWSVVQTLLWHVQLRILVPSQEEPRAEYRMESESLLNYSGCARVLGPWRSQQKQLNKQDPSSKQVFEERKKNLFLNYVWILFFEPGMDLLPSC